MFKREKENKYQRNAAREGKGWEDLKAREKNKGAHQGSCALDSVLAYFISEGLRDKDLGWVLPPWV